MVGVPTWTRAFAAVSQLGGSLDSGVAVSPDGSVVAVLTATSAHVLDGSGADRFTVTGLFGRVLAAHGRIATFMTPSRWFANSS